MRNLSINRNSKSLVLDTDIVLCLHKLGIWDIFINKWPVVLAETVVGQAEYIEDPYTLKRTYLHLNNYSKSGEIKEISINASDIIDMQKKLQMFNPPLIHSGEIESIAVAYLDIQDILLLCLADKAAIHCAVFLGLEDKLISLKRALSPCNISVSLPYQFTEQTLKETLDVARKNLIGNFSTKK